MAQQRRSVFGDTAYWIALIDPRQSLHRSAVAASQHVGATLIVTSDLVLVELLNFFCEFGPYWRGTVVTLVDRLRQAPSVSIEPQTRDLFTEGLELYRRRRDKGYSVTDCTSMVIMRRLGIGEVLTSDRHFQQEGFTILL